MNQQDQSKISLALPKTVLILAVVGLLVNISTTMIYSQLPMYMKNVLHAPARVATTIDGIVEALSHVTRIASGFISDLLRHRKSVLTVGYSLVFFAKPLYLFSSSIVMVFLAQSLDRFGNGTIASPRDALVGDVTAKPKRGASYGFLRSLRTTGSVLGALCAMGVMWWTADDFMMVFTFAIIPSLFALLLLIFAIKEPKRHKGIKNERFSFSKDHLKGLHPSFWKLIGLASLFELAHFSETLLSWRAHEVGIPQKFVAFVMVAMNFGQLIVAYPLGLLADRFNRKLLLGVGMLFMMVSCLCLGYGTTVPIIMTGVIFWGAQMSATQSVYLSIISSEVGKELRGTAFGIFYLMTGICYLIASETAGFLWDFKGYTSTFLYGAIISVVAIIMIYPSTKKIPTHATPHKQEDE